MRRIGITVGSLVGSVRWAVELCREAESLGYTDVWSEEGGGTDGTTPLAAAASVTSEVRLGSAILPVFTRPPALLAMTAAALQDLSGGRFALGLGTSSSIIVERWMGGAFDRPLVRLRETVEAVREILTGRKVTYEGRTIRIDGFRLQHPIEAPVPIHLAALGPRACRLAGRVGDGVAFFMKTPSGVRQALAWVREGAEEAGRDPAEIESLIRLPVAVDEDPELLGFMERRILVAYAMVDVYNASLRAQGFGAEAAAIEERWRAGERDAARTAISDEMLDELFVTGTVEECRAQLDAYRAAGITTPVIFPVSLAGDPQERREKMRETLKLLAPT